MAQSAAEPKDDRPAPNHNQAFRYHPRPQPATSHPPQADRRECCPRIFAFDTYSAKAAHHLVPHAAVRRLSRLPLTAGILGDIRHGQCGLAIRCAGSRSQNNSIHINTVSMLDHQAGHCRPQDEQRQGDKQSPFWHGMRRCLRHLWLVPVDLGGTGRNSRRSLR